MVFDRIKQTFSDSLLTVACAIVAAATGDWSRSEAARATPQLGEVPLAP